MRRILASLALLAIATAAQAAPLNVPVDQSRRLAIAGEAANVVVGNTQIADVRAVDSRTIMVIGKRPGVTNVVVFDPAGRALTDQQVMVSAGVGAAVTVFSGGATTEYACSPYCSAIGHTDAPAMPAAPATAPAAP